MKRFCTVLLVLTVIVVGLGFYRGWFAVSGGRTEEGNNVDVKLTVDTDKVKADADLLKKDAKDSDQQ